MTFALAGRRTLLAVAAAVSTLAVVTSCASDPGPPPRASGATVLVVGARNNMPAPLLSDDLKDSVLTDAIRSKDTITLVGVSGEPRQTYQEKMSTDCDSPEACTPFVKRKLKEITEKLGQIRASAPEADTLGALSVATRAMQGGPAGGPKQIIVVDNGLQTTGELRLQTPRALFSDPQEVAASLRSGQRLPDMTGINVTWVGLASATAPQEVADERPRANLQALWEKIIQAAGGTVTFAGTLSDGAPPSFPDLPPVTAVDVKDTPLPPSGDPCPKIFDDQVGFVPGQATFRDAQRARDVLTPIADGLKQRNQAATITGYIALPEEAGANPLSGQRAEAVRGVLVELGVLENLLTTKAGGLAPEAPRGTSSPVALQQYRRVEITSGTCGGV